MKRERILHIGSLAYQAIAQLGIWLLIAAGIAAWIVRCIFHFVALPAPVGRAWRKPTALQEASSKVTAAVVDTALVSVLLLVLATWAW